MKKFILLLFIFILGLYGQEEKILTKEDLDKGYAGIGVYKDTKETLYKGEFMNGKSEGSGKTLWKNGDTYEGQYSDGNMDGLGKFYIYRCLCYSRSRIGGWKLHCQ